MIITVEDIKKYRPIAKNIGAEEVNVYIREAERLDVLPVIGAKLYKELSSLGPVTNSKGEIILDDAGQEISSGIEGELPADLHKFLNGGEYQNAAGELVRFEGVRAALCYLAYARFVRNHSINVTAFGVVQKVGDYSSPIDQELIISASRDAKKIGDEYLSRSMKFWNETHAEPQKPAGRVRRFVSIGD